MTPPSLGGEDSNKRFKPNKDQKADDHEDDHEDEYTIALLPIPSSTHALPVARKLAFTSQDYRDRISYIIMKRTGLIGVYFTVSWGDNKDKTAFTGHFRQLAKESGHTGNLNPRLKLTSSKCQGFPLLYGPYSTVDFDTKKAIRESTSNAEGEKKEYPATMFLMVPKLDKNGKLSVADIEKDLWTVAKVSAELHSSYFEYANPSIGLDPYPNQTKKKHASATLDQFITGKMVVNFVADHWKVTTDFYSKFPDYASVLFEDPQSSRFAREWLGYPKNSHGIHEST